jgi:hypothetical protein
MNRNLLFRHGRCYDDGEISIPEQRDKTHAMNRLSIMRSCTKHFLTTATVEFRAICIDFMWKHQPLPADALLDKDAVLFTEKRQKVQGVND